MLTGRGVSQSSGEKSRTVAAGSLCAAGRSAVTDQQQVRRGGEKESANDFQKPANVDYVRGPVPVAVIHKRFDQSAKGNCIASALEDK